MGRGVYSRMLFEHSHFQLLNWRILSAVTILPYGFSVSHSMWFDSIHFDWWWCYRRIFEWCLQTAKIKFNFLQILTQNAFDAHKHTQRHYFLSLSFASSRCIRNCAFFRIQIEFSLPLERNAIWLHIKSQSSVWLHIMPLYTKLCEWKPKLKPKPAPWIHANVNGWQLQMILLFRFLRMDFFPFSVHLFFFARWFKCVACSISSVCLNIEKPFNFPFVWKFCVRHFRIQMTSSFFSFSFPIFFVRSGKVVSAAMAVAITNNHIVSVSQAVGLLLGRADIFSNFQTSMTCSMCQQSMFLLAFQSMLHIGNEMKTHD